MKAISTQLSNHLDQEVTTLCSCWRIVRKDGREFYFTDHDQDVVFEGNTYEAESSYDRTAVQSGADFGVANLDVSGFFDSDKITDEEMRAGLFNRADVYVFIVNWTDPTMGALKVRRGWFGEVTLTQSGKFVTEIRGLAQALAHNWIEVYQGECRADFCDKRCKLNIADYKYRATVSDRGDGRGVFSGSDIPAAPTVGTSVGAHRYWSIKPTFYPTGTKYFVAEVRFRDQDGNLVSGGTAKDNIPDGIKPSRLRNGNYGDKWGFDSIWNDENDEGDPDIDIADTRWWIEFDNAVDIKEVEIIITNAVGEAFTSFELQYTTDEPDQGATWTNAKTCSFAWNTGGQSAVWSLGSPTESPINFTDAPSDLPAPQASVSSYVGGSIEWVTGKNAGRRVEILGFDESTNTVTMFENTAYPIEVGDLFDIAQGCDRTLTMCKLYKNVINRRAEDYVPGNDEMMKYPDAK